MEASNVSKYQIFYALMKLTYVCYWEKIDCTVLRSVSLCITLSTKKNLEIKFGKLFVDPISISYTQCQWVDVNLKPKTSSPKSLENLFIQKCFSTLVIYYGIPTNIKCTPLCRYFFEPQLFWLQWKSFIKAHMGHIGPNSTCLQYDKFIEFFEIFFVLMFLQFWKQLRPIFIPGIINFVT